eukprot:COSAG02_NODE_10436_length_1941_cov_1.203040_3_plen_69_part_00
MEYAPPHKISNKKKQLKIMSHYAKNGILAVWAPGANGLQPSGDGADHSVAKIGGKGSVVYLAQDNSDF